MDSMSVTYSVLDQNEDVSFDLRKEDVALVAVLENPNYIRNIGTVIRNINALGVDALLVIDNLNRLDVNISELRQRKSLLKYSNGAVKWTNVKRFDSVEDCFEFLQAKDFVSVGTSPHAIGKRQVSLAKSDLTVPKLAIWFGAESNGLSEAVINKCEYCLTIEMKGRVESLNLSTTTGIVLYEAVKQRNT
jgi:tRNA (guanosine-2'-O-)-methyltransferase